MGNLVYLADMHARTANVAHRMLTNARSHDARMRALRRINRMLIESRRAMDMRYAEISRRIEWEQNGRVI